MDIQQQKFRIKVIERNDGVKMYHPQVREIVDMKPPILWFGEMKLVYDWRGLTTAEDGYDTLGWKDKSDGCGTTDIESANKMIEQYKVDFKKRCEVSREKEQKEKNEAIKEITYIEIP